MIEKIIEANKVRHLSLWLGGDAFGVIALEPRKTFEERLNKAVSERLNSSGANCFSLLDVKNALDGYLTLDYESFDIDEGGSQSKDAWLVILKPTRLY